MPDLKGLARELKRRKVYRVAGAYVIVGAVLAGAANDILPRLGLPEWTVSFVVILLLLGFPLALALAWAYEVKPEEPRVTLEVTAPTLRIHESESRQSIAVLPFANMSDDPGYEYFSDGMTEEIINALTQLQELRVAARTSSFAFKGTTPDLREVGAKLNVETALELASDLPEAHLALGRYHFWLPDLDQALREVAIAERSLPGDATVLRYKARVLWRLERWDEAVSTNRRAAVLDPRDPSTFRALGRQLALLRRYAEAEQYLYRALELQPENVSARSDSAGVPWWRDGDPEPWRRQMMDPDLPHVHWVGSLRWEAFFSSRLYEDALEVLRTMDVEFERWHPYFPGPLLKGITHRFAGEPELARAAFDSARVVLEKRVQEEPDDPKVHRALGLAYAGLGMRGPAIQEGLLVADLQPGFQAPVLYVGFGNWGLAWIHMLLGDHDPAVEHLDTLLALPTGRSVSSIRADPWFHELHDHPGFQALLDKYGSDVER